MAAYSLTLEINGEHWATLEMPFASDTQAIERARDVLQAKIDYRAPELDRANSASIGVGRGSIAKIVTWLGEWQWTSDANTHQWHHHPITN
jgi:hypothetical protein